MVQKTPDKAMACASCHGVALDDAFKAGHAKSYPAESCVTCHHYELAAKDWGHQQHSEDFGVDCTSCHHADTNIEPEPQSCANCHEAGARPTNKAAEPGTPPVLADAVHARCAACHQDLFGKAKMSMETNIWILSVPGDRCREGQGERPVCRLHGLPCEEDAGQADPRPYGRLPRPVHGLS